MRNVYEVLREKECAIDRIRREIEALRSVSQLLADEGDSRLNTSASAVFPEGITDTVTQQGNARGRTTPLLVDEVEDAIRSSGVSATTGESAPKLAASLDACSGLCGGSMQTSEAHSCDDTEAANEVSTPAPGSALPTAADILDRCFPSFRVVQPEVKTARLRLGDLWTPSLLLLLITLALLLGWMLGRVSSRRIADTKGPPLVSTNPDAVTAQPEKNRQADQTSQPPGSRRPRSPKTPRDSLVVYERGRVIFRLKQEEDVASGNPKWGESLPHPAQGSLGPTTALLVRRDEPEYPEAARQ